MMVSGSEKTRPVYSLKRVCFEEHRLHEVLRDLEDPTSSAPVGRCGKVLINFTVLSEFLSSFSIATVGDFNWWITAAGGIFGARSSAGEGVLASLDSCSTCRRMMMLVSRVRAGLTGGAQL